MADNLMNSAHKATNQKYRENYERIFGKGNVDRVKVKKCGDWEVVEVDAHNPDAIAIGKIYPAGGVNAPANGIVFDSKKYGVVKINARPRD